MKPESPQEVLPPDLSAVDALRSLSLAAIDFETATPSRESACSLAVTIVEDGRVVETRAWLVRPPRNEYSPFNIMIHGISPDATARAPEFPVVWAQVKEIIGELSLVAHNASFDVSVLRHSMDHYGIDWPSSDVFCTLMLSRLLWPGKLSYSLPSLAGFLSLPLERHHDPQADSIVCAEIARRLCIAAGTTSLVDIAKQRGFHAGQLGPRYWTPCAVDIATRAGSIARLQPTSDKFDPEHPLYGKRVAFTGALLSMARKDAAQLVVDAGGSAMTNVSNETDYLVFGEQDYSRFVGGEMSAKTRRAEEFVLAGYGIEIISEADFLEMVEPS